jgi:hypothetical protein
VLLSPRALGHRISPSSPFLQRPAPAKVILPISQSISERAQALTGVGAHDPREMALINESEIGREVRQILVPVGQAFKCDRDANSIPKL